MKTARDTTLGALGITILLSAAPEIASGDTPQPHYPVASPVLCFKNGAPQWYVDQAVARAALKRVTLSLSGGPLGEYQFPDSYRWSGTAMASACSTCVPSTRPS